MYNKIAASRSRNFSFTIHRGTNQMALEGRYSQTRIDYDGETSNFGFRVEPLTAANFDAQHALKVAFAAAVTAIVLGNKVSDSEANVDVIGTTLPASQFAQREMKWLVRWHDSVNDKAYSTQLPTADLAVLDPNNRGYAEIGDAGVVDAFVTAFEAYALSQDGNPVVVDSIQFVGRNL